MAQRFGGKYSPQGKASEDPGQQAVRQAVQEDRQVDAAGAKANLLFLPPIVLAVISVWRTPEKLLLGLAL